MSDFRVLISGGTGFVGSHLAKRCIELGWGVSILYEPNIDTHSIREIEEFCHLYPVSGRTIDLVQSMAEIEPHVVIHLASIYRSDHHYFDIEPLICSNILFATQILEAMKENGIRYFINTGTSFQHFENQNYNPVNLYAATKHAFEQILAYYIEIRKINAITLKLFDTYGPFDSRSKLISMFKNAVRRNEAIELSPGEQYLDLVYIDDVVNAYVIAAERLICNKVKKYESYAVSSGKLRRLKDLVEIFNKASGKELMIKWGESPYRNREVMLPWSKGRSLPGWEPRIDIEQGIRKLMEE